MNASAGTRLLSRYAARFGAVTAPSERASTAQLSPPDPVVVGMMTGLGGRLGSHARPVRRSTAVRVVVALTLLTCLLGFAQKAPCRVHPWADEYQFTRGCYTDVFALYFAENLAPHTTPAGVASNGDRPYLDHPVEYPVVIGGAMALVADAVHVFPSDQQARRFFDLTWLLLTGCAVLVAVSTARLAGRRRTWDAAMFALAPSLLLHVTTNWDLIATALAGLGLLQWSRRRPLAAGVLLGLATATKLYPVLFLLPLFVLCLRAGKLRAWVVTAGALVLSVAALTVPVYLASPSFAEVNGQQVQVAGSPWSRLDAQGLAALAPHTAGLVAGKPVTAVNAVYRFVQLNQTRGADWDSLFFALQTARDRTAGNTSSPWATIKNKVAGAAADLVLDKQVADGAAPSRLNAAVAVFFVLLMTMVLLLAWKAPRRPRLAPMLFLTVVAFLLSSKVFSPQYVIWLLPLAVLARPRWRPFLAWQLTEALVLFSRFYFFVGNDKAGQGLDITWFIAAVLLRDAALLVFCGFVVRDIWRPELDVVRQQPAVTAATVAPRSVPGRLVPGRAGGSRPAREVNDRMAADRALAAQDEADRDDPAGGVLAGAPDRRPARR